MPESRPAQPFRAGPLIVKPLISTLTPEPPSTVTTSLVPVDVGGRTIVVCAEPAPASLSDLAITTCSGKLPAQT